MARKEYDPSVYLDYFLQSKTDMSAWTITTVALKTDMKKGQLLDSATGAVVVTGFKSCYMLMNDYKAGTTEVTAITTDARLKPTVLVSFSANAALQKEIKEFLFTHNIHVQENK
ncbi:hypothetical protein [Photobacterium iliopiscarium]|uniref:hypothetical protein n=1 Tax=Photobacterium iliopiscarium TaxID=56192 RepID=UPI001E5D2B54|nr:hypothetical protein [Photobacterium iliopiscarium]MCD9489130.1 hypothetical protein [Photobacterium iliopiscarium]MCF2245804.1 hypothetical protein [Photobacterium iliopiscarium]